MVQPPPRSRLLYQLFDIRLPPAYLEWVERDIASPAWLVREITRLLALFVVTASIFGRLDLSLRTGIVLAAVVGVVIAAQRPLRRVAAGYQRYGWDWEQHGGAPWVRIALAAVFTVAFVLLAG